jgi:hypothetical protein
MSIREASKRARIVSANGSSATGGRDRRVPAASDKRATTGTRQTRGNGQWDTIQAASRTLEINRVLEARAAVKNLRA